MAVTAHTQLWCCTSPVYMFIPTVLAATKEWYTCLGPLGVNNVTGVTVLRFCNDLLLLRVCALAVKLMVCWRYANVFAWAGLLHYANRLHGDVIYHKTSIAEEHILGCSPLPIWFATGCSVIACNVIERAGTSDMHVGLLLVDWQRKRYVSTSTYNAWCDIIDYRAPARA
jgi:hypothetical protein